MAVHDGAVFNLFTLISMIQLATILFVVITQYVILNPKKLLKKYLNTKPEPSVFEFGEDTIKITYNSKQSRGVSNLNYDSAENAEKKGDFYMLQLKNVGRITFKESEITEGTPEELRMLLANKLGKKFKIKN